MTGLYPDITYNYTSTGSKTDNASYTTHNDKVNFVSPSVEIFTIYINVSFAFSPPLEFYNFIQPLQLSILQPDLYSCHKLYAKAAT